MQVESFFEWLGQALGSVIRFIVDGLSGLFGALTHAGGNFIDGLSRTLGMDTSIISIITLSRGVGVAVLGGTRLYAGLDYRGDHLADAGALATQLGRALTVQPLDSPCRSELAREKLKGAALIQETRVLVDVFREQARS